MRRCRHGPVGASTNSHRTSSASASGSSPTTSFPPDAITRNRRLAETALRPWTPVFTHGDLQVDHVFVAGDEVTGVIDWSEASRGDALFDLATLTLGHQEHLGDVAAGYGTDVDRDLIRAWWSLRCLLNVRWLVEHGFGPPGETPEVAVLRSRP
jgi:aminoglycoside phosphotransferase (APT) family kinase protein